MVALLIPSLSPSLSPLSLPLPSFPPENTQQFIDEDLILLSMPRKKGLGIDQSSHYINIGALLGSSGAPVVGEG